VLLEVKLIFAGNPADLDKAQWLWVNNQLQNAAKGELT
jgi:hypothetical protein